MAIIAGRANGRGAGLRLVLPDFRLEQVKEEVRIHGRVALDNRVNRAKMSEQEATRLREIAEGLEREAERLYEEARLVRRAITSK